MDIVLFGATAVATRFLSSSISSSFRTSFNMTSTPPITYKLLAQQNAETSSALIDFYATNPKFAELATTEGDSTVKRDKEDDEKLQAGIDFAKSKGVIDPDFVPEPYVTIDVLGKTPDQVADQILADVKAGAKASSSSAGSVIVLVGLSGTGKGTTVTNLIQKLQEQEGKQVVSWSNGNIFRSLTLLAATWCEQQSDMDGFDADKALTKQNLASFMKMLSFGKFNGKYDTRIHGLGLDLLVSQVQNTDLKAPKVSKNIPAVAKFTQGEVILFAASAVETMGKDGIFVLLEGREQTVNYVRTPHRFTLVLSDESLIGKRRAAQRLMAAALTDLSADATEAQVASALNTSLEKMASEI
jgi:cytidylate kinase